MRLDELGPFGCVLDVGGNVGDFAEQARELWPDASVTSFEPIAELADLNRERARGRWWVEQVAVSAEHGSAMLHVCRNQHSASTMQEPGSVRRERFRIADRFEDRIVRTVPLDDYLRHVRGRLLVKVDVEGHEAMVLAGAGAVLDLAAVVIVECNQADVFQGAPTPAELDWIMRGAALTFAGVLGSLADPSGELVQFDGVWMRRGA